MEATIVKVNFMSSITHDSRIQQDKINYFVDCLNLITETVGFPFFSQRLNARILCNSLLEILCSTSSSKYLYFKHYYTNYKCHLSPSNILNIKYSDSLLKLDRLFDAFIEAKPWDKNREVKNYSPDELIKTLQEITLSLNDNYFDTLIEELKLAIFCREDLFQHDHLQIIEECAKSIIVELYNIGYTKEKINNIFAEAIANRYENFEKLAKSQILKIPVPFELFALQSQISFIKYKNKVKKYVQENSLKNQFNNLKYLFNQSQRNRKYVFKIKNLRIEDDSEIVYDGVLFSSNPSKRYVNDNSRAGFKKFFKSDKTVSFCEAEIFNGNEVTALQQAISKIQGSIDFVYYHVAVGKVKRINKPYLDLSEYVEVDKTATLTKRYGSSSVSTFDLKYLEELKPLEGIKGKEIVNEYLKLDKIFIGAYASESDFVATSELWRYCESLFDDSTGITSAEMTKILVEYYLRKRNVHLYTGLQRMLFAFTNRLLYSPESKIKEIGLTFQELHELCNKEWEVKEYVKTFNRLVKHPLINCKKDKLFNLRTGQITEELKHHFTLILNSMYYQRNLHQHSNISIERLKNIWFEESLRFVETLRIYIIKDLKSNPNINKLETLFKV